MAGDEALGGVTGILQHCGMGERVSTITWNIRTRPIRKLMG